MNQPFYIAFSTQIQSYAIIWRTVDREVKCQKVPFSAYISIIAGGIISQKSNLLLDKTIISCMTLSVKHQAPGRNSWMVIIKCLSGMLNVQQLQLFKCAKLYSFIFLLCRRKKFLSMLVTAYINVQCNLEECFQWSIGCLDHGHSGVW